MIKTELGERILYEAEGIMVYEHNGTIIIRSVDNPILTTGYDEEDGEHIVIFDTNLHKKIG